MQKTLEIRVEVHRLPLSRASIVALRNLNRYDLVVCTSKNARKFFAVELKERRVQPAQRTTIIQVGPRRDLLKFPIDNMHILFPRSALAPYDIVRQLRARGAVVRVIPLYTTDSVPLSPPQKESLLRGEVARLAFKSPSGVHGLVGQLEKKEREVVFRIPAQCIGYTTARAAREAGFKKISIKSV
ncbi:MAG: uroporphyrinogen-III synthase [bacterium]|nr:uroporphyrinogen-III synthase [bacterium]